MFLYKKNTLIQQSKYPIAFPSSFKTTLINRNAKEAKKKKKANIGIVHVPAQLGRYRSFESMIPYRSNI